MLKFGNKKNPLVLFKSPLMLNGDTEIKNFCPFNTCMIEGFQNSLLRKSHIKKEYKLD